MTWDSISENYLTRPRLNQNGRHLEQKIPPIEWCLNVTNKSQLVWQ